MNIYLSNLIKFIIPYLVVILLGIGFSNIWYIVLPKIPMQFQTTQNQQIPYLKYYLSYNFTKQQKPIQKKEYKLLSNIKLKAIYLNIKQNSGWIIIEDNKAKTYILSVNEKFNNYTLKKILESYVIFEKNSKEYKLSLDKTKLPKNINNTISNNAIKQIDNNFFEVSKNQIKTYRSNFGKIWKDISIKTIRKNGKINGFQITHIAKNSAFAKLGLQTRDIIQSVNNIKLKSYADAFRIYKNIDKLKNLKFTILRNNKPMEIEYEIK